MIYVPMIGWGEASAGDFLPRTVITDERPPTFVGLLDARGNKLMRVDDKRPIGFVKLKEVA